MKPVQFNPDTDLAPTPFDERHLEAAEKLKNLGLKFQPHVGCFVWDSQELIAAPSPFPNRVYFILSLPRFVDIFGSPEKIADKLVWLPTWQQARLLCSQRGIGSEQIAALLGQHDRLSPGDELLQLYTLLASDLKDSDAGAEKF